MRLRVVTYAPDALTGEVARRIGKRFSADLSTIHCDRYAGVLGPLRQWHDRSRGNLPEIEVDPPIGTADALIVGAPLEGGDLASALRRFLQHPGRIPPVLGVFGTCARRYPALGFEAEVERLTNSFGEPEAVIVSQRDMDTAGDAAPRGLNAFLDRLQPTAEIQLMPVVVPFRAA
jgi:hypothetical protein